MSGNPDFAGTCERCGHDDTARLAKIDAAFGPNPWCPRCGGMAGTAARTIPEIDVALLEAKLDDPSLRSLE